MVVTAGAVVGILVALVPARARLLVRGTVSEYIGSPDLVRNYLAARKAESYDFLKGYLADYFAKGRIMTAAITGKQSYDLAYDLSNLFDQAWADTRYKGPPDGSTGSEAYLYSIAVVNRGKRTAKSAKLVSQVSGVFETIMGGKRQQASEFTHDIPLGDIQPHTDILVRIWTPYDQSYAESTGTFVTHEDGSSAVQFGVTVFGGLRFVADKWYWIPAMVSTAALIVWLAVLGLRSAGLGFDRPDKKRRPRVS